MQDLAANLIYTELDNFTGTPLLIADEATRIPLTSAAGPLVVLTNRYDIAQYYSDQCNSVHFNDFVFSELSSEHFDGVFYRVSKEKAIAQHVINQAFLHLKPGQSLIMAGYKNEGIKTYINRAEALFACKADIVNGGKTSKLAKLTRHGTTEQPRLLDSRHYEQLREALSLQGQTVWSKPGIFGWDKIDKGSQFLVDHLPTWFGDTDLTQCKILDLGCGYGYLSLMVAQKPFQRLVATDSNAAAITACQANLKSWCDAGVVKVSEFSVIADDCARQIDESFHYIVCNPPFHRGFDTDQTLTERFLQETKRHLITGGRALFVVNQFIGLEKIAADLFSKAHVIARNKSFKLVELIR